MCTIVALSVGTNNESQFFRAGLQTLETKARRGPGIEECPSREEVCVPGVRA